MVTRFAPGTTGGFDARILHSHVHDTRPRSSMDQSARLRTWWLEVRILPRAFNDGDALGMRRSQVAVNHPPPALAVRLCPSPLITRLCSSPDRTRACEARGRRFDSSQRRTSPRRVGLVIRQLSYGCAKPVRFRRSLSMVAVAQTAEPLAVVQAVAGSNPAGHPSRHTQGRDVTASMRGSNPRRPGSTPGAPAKRT